MQEKQERPLPLNRFDYLVIGLIAIGFAIGTICVLASYVEIQRLINAFNSLLPARDSDTWEISWVIRRFDIALDYSLACLFIGNIYLISWSHLNLKASQKLLHMKTFIVAAFCLTAGIVFNWHRFEVLRFGYNQILPYVAELDQQASQVWQLFNGAINLLLIGFGALALGTTTLIAWTIYRIWQMPALMKRPREA